MPDREVMRWKHYHEEKEQRATRKFAKRNRKPPRPRDKGWRLDTDELESLDGSGQDERIMPRDERERQRVTTLRAQAALEVEDLAPVETGLPDAPGTVVEVATGLCRVVLDGRVLTCAVRGALSSVDTGFTNLVAVGDRVRVSLDGAGQGVIEEVLPRRSLLARPDSHLQQVLVANLDQLLVVASWRQPALWAELIDRYLIAAQRIGIEPIVCVNKIDLAEDPAAARAELAPYRDLGVNVLFTSAATGEGLTRLRQVLPGRVTALVGLSGVGKSSLLQAVQPGLALRTGDVSEHSGQGRHTTTQVTLLPLALGGYVVDTPGIREFGLSGLTRADLAQFYPDLRPFAAHCRFANCSHTHEPECAVKAAVADGQLSPMRYHSYACIYESLP